MATIVRWNPFREMAAMQSALDRLFDESWRTTWPSLNSLAFDVLELEQEYQAVVAIPGVSADQINIRFEDHTLTVSVEIPQPQLPEKARVIVQERPFGKFSRSIQLPQPIQIDHAEASYENGLLILRLPKSEEAQPKQIPVKATKMLSSKN